MKCAHSECKLDCQLVVGRLAPLPPLLQFGWRLAELPAGAAALPLPAALQEDPAPAHIDTVIVTCYLYAAWDDVVTDRENSCMCVTDCIQMVQLQRITQERIQCLASKAQTLYNCINAKL